MEDAGGIEAELEEARARCRALMDACPDGLVVVGGAGEVLELNRAAERVFGLGAGEAAGRSLAGLVAAADRPAFARRLAGGAWTGEAAGLRSDGTSFPMEISMGAARAGGRRRVVVAVRDLSERRRVEAQLLQASKMEAIGRLTGGIAHDFNNLLAVLMMDIEMLGDLVGGDGEARELVDEALDAARGGAELVRRLLAFARRQRLAPAAVDVGALVTSLAGLMGRTLGAEVRIDAAAPAGLWTVVVDGNQLESAILNLAVNARDAMPGGGRLALDCRNVSVAAADPDRPEGLAPGDYVRLGVADTGEGMAPEVARQAFEPFFTTKEGGRGTGLGLSMVYGFAKQSGGGAAIRSEAGRGTTVELYFPRAERAPGGEAAGRPPLPSGGERVLLVEDDPAFRGRTAAALRSLGYRVAAARDGEEALGLLRSGAAPELLVADAVLPGGIDGAALARKAARGRPSLRVLLMTGRDDRAAGIAGGVDVLRKPFTRQTLAFAVRRALGGARNGSGQPARTGAANT